MSAATALKILTAQQWAAFQSTGRFEGAPVDLADGYIHMSTADQAAETLSKHFGGQDDLVLAQVALAPLGDALKWEVSRGGQLFPHHYGVLTLADVITHAPIVLGADGRHILPAL